MAMASLSRCQRTHSHDATACRYFGRAVAGVCISSRLGRRERKQNEYTTNKRFESRRSSKNLPSKSAFCERTIAGSLSRLSRLSSKVHLARLPIADCQVLRQVFSFHRDAYHVDLFSRIPRTMNIPMRFVVVVGASADSPAKYRSRRQTRLKDASKELLIEMFRDCGTRAIFPPPRNRARTR